MRKLLISMLFLVANSANASVLYDSGAPLVDSGTCDGDGCGSSTEWWATDDFTASSDWGVTGFEFFSNLRSGAITDYISTSWEIISSADPYGAALYSGTSVATISGDSFLISGLDIDVLSGAYFLSHHHDFSNENLTTAMVTGDTGTWYHTDKASYQNVKSGEVAMIIYGDVSSVPVPAAVWLFGSGLIGLIGFARRKKV